MSGPAVGYDVVIPAGGTIDAEYAQAIGTSYRALAPLGGAPIMQTVAEALRASGCVRRVIGVAPAPVQEAIGGVDVWLPAGPSGARNIRDGLAAADPERQALVCASDLPLLTPAAIADFLARCRPNAEIAGGLVRADDYIRMFPDAPPSQFVRLSDAGPCTLGGLFVIHPSLLTRHHGLFERLFQSRKSQWQMARLLGIRLLCAWATGSLSLAALTERAQAILGGTIQVVPDVSPILAYDIDTADDYTYAQFHLRSPASAPFTEFPQ